MPKERPKSNAQRVQKIQNLKVTEFKPKKIEKSVGQPARPKSKLKHHDAAMELTKDDLNDSNEESMYDEDTNGNVGVHNLSTGSETSLVAAVVHDETAMTERSDAKTERSDAKNEDGLEKPNRDKTPKDKLKTTGSGNIVRKVPYVIPKNQR